MTLTDTADEAPVDDTTDRNEAAFDDWPARFFKDVDTFEVDRLAAWFSDDVEVRFGNAPALHGHAAALEAFTGFYATIRGVSHRRETVVTSGDLATQQSVVTYTRLTAAPVSLPVASHLRRTGSSKIDRLWIFIDMTPLYAPETGAAI